MRVSLVIVILGLVANTALAGQVFEGVTGKSLIQGVDDCSATKLLDRAITESGVNPLDTPPVSVGTCSCAGERPKCEGTAKDVLAGWLCQKDDIIKCFANTPEKLPALCVRNPRSVTLDKEYGDVGQKKDVRARFSEIYVIRKNASGFSSKRVWTMDKDGCEPVKAYNDNPIDTPEECEILIRSYVTGGPIFPPSSRQNFADGNLSQDHLSAIRELNGCLEAYPKLGSFRTYSKTKTNAGKTTVPDGTTK